MYEFHVKKCSNFYSFSSLQSIKFYQMLIKFSVCARLSEANSVHEKMESLLKKHSEPGHKNILKRTKLT